MGSAPVAELERAAPTARSPSPAAWPRCGGHSVPVVAAASASSAPVAYAGTALAAADEHLGTPEAARWPASLPVRDGLVEAEEETVVVVLVPEERHTTVIQNQRCSNAICNEGEMNTGIKLQISTVNYRWLKIIWC